MCPSPWQEAGNGWFLRPLPIQTILCQRGERLLYTRYQYQHKERLKPDNILPRGCQNVWFRDTALSDPYKQNPGSAHARESSSNTVPRTLPRAIFKEGISGTNMTPTRFHTTAPRQSQGHSEDQCPWLYTAVMGAPNTHGTKEEALIIPQLPERSHSTKSQLLDGTTVCVFHLHQVINNECSV